MKKRTPEEQKFLGQLGQHVVDVRKSKGVTQQNVAALCDFEKAHLLRIEAGKTNAATLAFIMLLIPTSVFHSDSDNLPSIKQIFELLIFLSNLAL